MTEFFINLMPQLTILSNSLPMDIWSGSSKTAALSPALAAMAIAVAIFVIFITHVLFFSAWAVRKRALSHLPTPPLNCCNVRHLLLGTFGLLPLEGLKDRHRGIARLQREAGPVLLLKLPCCRSKVVFSKGLPSEWAARGVDSERSAFRSMIPKSLLALPLNEEWQIHRRIIAPLFSSRALDHHMPRVEALTRSMVSLWVDELEHLKQQLPSVLAAEETPPIELSAALKAWSLDMIGAIGFGHDFQCIQDLATSPMSAGAAKTPFENRFFLASEAILSEVLRRFRSPWPMYLCCCWKLRAYRRARAVYADVGVEIVRAKLEEDKQKETKKKKKKKKGGRSTSIIEALLTARDEGFSGKTLSTQDVLEETVSLLLAGHDTTSNSANWMLLLLARNPAQQAKLRATINAGWDGVAPLTSASLQEIGDGCLLTLVYETLRLFPTVPFTVKVSPRVWDAELGGSRCPIPAGQRFGVNKVLLGQDATRFPSPTTFDAFRPLEQFGARAKHIAAFGGGARVCVGYRLAELQLMAFAVVLLTTFEVREPGRASAGGVAAAAPPAPQEFVDITNGPKHSGMWLTLVRLQT